jgi:hypothetical protein
MNRKKTERAVKNVIAIVLFAFLFAVFSSLISGCRKDGKVQIYEVKTSGVMYQTSADNKRLKEPVEMETVYFVVGGEYE